MRLNIGKLLLPQVLSKRFKVINNYFPQYFQASLTDTSIDTALQVMNDQGLNMICKGCKTIFNTKHVNLYIIKARIQERSFGEVPNGILQNSTIPMRLGDMNDITSLGVRMPNFTISKLFL